MMLRISLLALLVIAGLSACQSVPTSTEAATEAATPSAATQDQPPPLPNLLIQSGAKVELRRKGSLTAVPVALGAELAPGDVITLTQGTASIFCGAETDWDANPRPLPIGQRAGVPCGVGRPPRPYPDAAIVRSRGGEAAAADEIQVLSPRTGWVLNDRPTLVWAEIGGAASYTVTLESDDDIIRTVVAAGAPLPYPQAWEPLQAEGASYRLVVETGDKSSGDKTPGFSLLENQDEFMEKVQRLQEHPLEEPARTLLLSELYLSYNLRSEAVDLLTALPDANEIIAVQSLLGETYLNMGRVAHGQTAYKRMAELAEAQGFIESQAQALVGLGFAACAVRDVDAATQHWSQASALFDQYGLTDQSTLAQALLVESEQRCK